MVRTVKPTEIQVESLFQDKVFFQDLKPTRKPKAIIFAGISGSGKSTCIKLCYELGKVNYFPIQADDYRRLHPKLNRFIEKYGREDAHKKTSGFAHYFARDLLDKVLDNQLNVIYETTLNNLETAYSLFEVLQNNQYEIIVIGLPVNVGLSIERNKQRFTAKLDINSTLPRIVETEVIEKMAINYLECLANLKITKKYNVKLYQVDSISQAVELFSKIQ